MKDNSFIGERMEKIRAALPQGVTLIAVSKYHPVESIEVAYCAGQRDFGESKAQDLVKKYQELPKDIKWHFIGHLQSNKIKYIAPFVHLIHSIDSYRLLQEVDRHAAKAGRRIPCLLQIHIAHEAMYLNVLQRMPLAFLQQFNAFVGCEPELGILLCNVELQ